LSQLQPTKPLHLLRPKVLPFQRKMFLLPSLLRHSRPSRKLPLLRLRIDHKGRKLSAIRRKKQKLPQVRQQQLHLPHLYRRVLTLPSYRPVPQTRPGVQLVQQLRRLYRLQVALRPQGRSVPPVSPGSYHPA